MALKKRKSKPWQFTLHNHQTDWFSSQRLVLLKLGNRVYTGTCTTAFLLVLFSATKRSTFIRIVRWTRMFDTGVVEEVLLTATAPIGCADSWVVWTHGMWCSLYYSSQRPASVYCASRLRCVGGGLLVLHRLDILQFCLLWCYFVPARDAMYCDERVCLSVCLSVRWRISTRTHQEMR